MPEYVLRVKVDPSDAKRGAAEVVVSLDKIEGRAKHADRAVGGLDTAFRTVRATALALGALAFFKKAISEAEQARVAYGQLEAGIRSTGGASGWTADQLAKQAGALQRLTGHSDEAIMAGQGILLTFTRIGRDAFPRATKAVLDMATRMGGDLRGAALQVGKALNDPIQGLTALSRAGVQFSDQQEKQIELMVRGGDVAAAQAVILKELETQFGGSAEAGRNSLNVLANSWSDLLERVGESSGGIKVSIEGTARALDFLTDHWHALEAAVFGVLANIVKWTGSGVVAVYKFSEALAGAGARLQRLSLSKRLREESAANAESARQATKDMQLFFRELEEGLRIKAAEAIDRQAESMGNLGEQIGGPGGPVEGMRDLKKETESLASALLGLRRVEIDFGEAVVESIEKQNRQWAITMAERARAIIELRNLGKEFAADVRDSLQSRLDAQGDVATEAAKEWQEAGKKIATYIREPIGQAWQSTKDMALDAITAAAMGQRVSVKDLIKDWLAMWFRAMAEWLVRWLTIQKTAQAGTVVPGATGAAAGGGGGWMSSLFGGGGGGSAAGGMSAGAAGALGVVAAFAVVYFGVKQWIDTHKKEWHAFALTGSSGTLSWSAVSGASVKRVVGVAEELIKGVLGIIEGLGGVFQSLEGQLQVGRKGRGKNTNWIVTYANGLVESFGNDMEAAMEFATIQAIKQSSVTGLSPLVQAAIRDSAARQLEQFQSDLAFAQVLATQNLPEAGAAVEGAFRLFRDQVTRASELFKDDLPALALAMESALTRFTSSLQGQYNQLMGIEEDPRQAWERQRVAYNQQRALVLAQLTLMKLELEGKIAQYNATRMMVTGMGRLTEGTLNMAGILLKTADAMNPALAALQAALDAVNAAIAAVPPEIGEGDYKPARGRRGGGRSGDRDTLQGILRDSELSGMAEWPRRLAEWNEKWAEAAKLAHNNRDLLAQVNAAKERELGLMRREVQDKYAPYLGGYGQTDFGLNTASFLADLESVPRVLLPNWQKAIIRTRFLADQLANVTTRIREFSGDPVLAVENIYAQAETLRKDLQAVVDAGGAAAVEAAKLFALIDQGVEYQKQQLGLGLIDKLFGYLKGSEQFESQRLEHERTKIDLEFRVIEAQLRALNMWDAATQNLFEAAKKAALTFAASSPTLTARDTSAMLRERAAREQEERLRLQEELVKQLAGVNQALREFKDSLKLDSALSPLTPLQRLQESERQYRGNLALAYTGDLDAASKVPDTFRAFLEQAKSFYGIGGKYLALFNEGQAHLDRLIKATSSPAEWEAGKAYNGPSATEQAQQALALQRQMQKVQGAVEEVGSIARQQAAAADQQTAILQQIASNTQGGSTGAVAGQRFTAA